MFPIVGLPRVRIRNTAFALKVNAGRRIRKNGADNALIESFLVEEGAFTRSVIWGAIRFPSYAGVDREVGGCLPGILQVKANVILTVVFVCNPALNEADRLSGQHVG